MSKKDNNKSPLDDVTARTDQEQLSQQALGNEDAKIEGDADQNTDLLSIPKTSGTGGNPSGAAPSSLIVHEDETGEERYESGEKADDEVKP